MKKRILTAIFALSLTLTACSSPLVGNDAKKSSEEESEDTSSDKDDNKEKEKEDNSTTETSEETSEEESASSSGTLAYENEITDLKPLYRLVTDRDPVYYYSDDYSESELAGEYHVESLLLMEECQDTYPELYDVLHKIAEEKHEIYLEEHEEFSDYALEDYTQRVEDGRWASKSYVKTRIFLKRCADQYLSYYDEISYCWEELRPYQKIGHNFDITTGKEVDLGDVLNITEDELNEIIATTLREDCPDDLDDLENVEDTLSKYHYGLETTGDDDRLYDWYFSVDGVHIVFNGYDLVDSFSFGNHEVLLSYDDYVNSEYVYAPEGSYSYMRSDMSIMDEGYFSGHHTDSPLLMYAEDETDDEFATSLILANGDDIARFDDVIYYIDSVNKVYDVFTADGKEYIYVTIEGMAEEWYLYVFDITDGGAKACDYTSHIHEYLGYTTDPDYAGEPVFSDPDHLMIPRLNDMLGSIISYSYDVVGDDGMPECKQTYFNVSWASMEITSLEDIDVYEILEDGTLSGEKTTIEKGTHFLPVRTDDETYVDCRLDDGRIVRLYIEIKDYNFYIDGVDVKGLFEGLIYAG